jgi:A/G-specific adenine glycosylase
MSSHEFKELIHWSKSQYNHLPWRENRTLYRTLVSEIMLQQTTVGTVFNHFEKFIKQFPNVKSLAKSTEEEVCVAWKGLGYYRRARNLRLLAIQIEEKFKGDIPIDELTLMGLKGIGPYTCNALIAIGADREALAVDANLERVLSRYYGLSDLRGLKLQKKLLSLFKEKKIIKERAQLSFRDLNEAFMDIGRVLCQSKKAACSLCPLRQKCVAHLTKNELKYPVVEENKTTLKEDLFIKAIRVIVREKHKVLMYQKTENEWLSGQWELPTFVFESNDPSFKQYPLIKAKKSYETLEVLKSGITKYKIFNYLYETDYQSFIKISEKIKRKYVFKKVDDALNLSSTCIKILKKK